MKRMLLTSDGLSTPRLRKSFKDLLVNDIQNTKVLVVHIAHKPRHKKYVRIIEKDLRSMGIHHLHIKTLNIIRRINPQKCERFDVIYLCGGNTFYILDRIRKTGLDTVIKRHVSKGRVYVGVSAGSIIPGREIRIAGWGSEGDINEIQLKDLNGLGLTNLAIFPHYRNELKKEVKEFEKTFRCRVQTLKDGEAVKIVGDSIQRIR